ncbi:SusD/RagB family nutrient-binding outer membrane lipoprotein [Hymenobacter monticola]|uniref:SusD/RagB family nutrient-binding outer membrane lipoprotein n=1 Tax=Hymenobacter monticola TaxID=1705399 RepID=A0ABY4B4T9_9BACT|nr:SusD/RagB family nutrient-binding outer membrane lipoprotein [Hymenobacter monticola]UOE34020.1 SusD/RagB family nutrient-binding outer membrane lipoprotein [Hymenobacter monticola]
MKKLIIAGASALALTTSCVGSLDEKYNVDPKSPTTALASGFVANAERTLVRTLVSTNVNLNPFRFYVQYWAATDYPNESRYDLNTRSIPTGFWNALYRDCLRDLREAKANIPSDITIPAESKDNALAATEVLEIYTWATLVETYGNVPYTQALDFNTARPAYDDQARIYTDLIARLDVAISKFNPAANTGFFTTTASADLLNNNSTALWLKFANSLKLRMALIIADVDPAKAATMAAATTGKVLASNADVIDLAFNGTFPNTNPLYEDLVRSARTDFAGTSFFINRLKGTAGPVTGVVDPRLNDYFNPVTSTTQPAGTFTGGTYGSGNSKSLTSLPGTKLRGQTLPGVLMSYAQVEFMLAEARERGFAVGGTPESHYNAAVTASITEPQWGGTAAEAAAYLAEPTVAYATAGGPGATYKQKIGYQKWVALYNQPVEAWTEWRRLDYPVLTAPNTAISGIPVRLLYPVVEQNINGENYAQAASAIGGDKVETKLFWDKF